MEVPSDLILSPCCCQGLLEGWTLPLQLHCLLLPQQLLGCCSPISPCKGGHLLLLLLLPLARQYLACLLLQPDAQLLSSLVPAH